MEELKISTMEVKATITNLISYSKSHDYRDNEGHQVLTLNLDVTLVKEDINVEIRVARKSENIEDFDELKEGSIINVKGRRNIAGITSYEEGDEIKYHTKDHISWSNGWSMSNEKALRLVLMVRK